MKQHAVLLSRGEETGDARNVDLSEYHVQLSYMDLDGDRILICDDADVSEAMLSGPLKIQATVQSKQSTKATQTFIPTNETGTQPKAPDATDAFADLINCAMASANAGLSAALPPPTRTAKKLERKIQKAARTSSEALQKALEEASSQTTKATSYAESKVAKAVKKAEIKLSRTEKKVEEALAALSKAAEGQQTRPPQDSNPKPEEELFIHGRHTCDACLTTPIMGKRFHAINMKDYDLCEVCHEQYKGDEIKFTEAKLDRDVGLQVRWHRKFDTIKKYSRQGPRERCSSRGPPARGPHPHGPPHAPPPPPPHLHHSGPPPHLRHSGPRHHCGPYHRPWEFATSHSERFTIPQTEASPSCGRPQASDDFDYALNEAIRQSKEDMKTVPSAPTEEELVSSIDEDMVDMKEKESLAAEISSVDSQVNLKPASEEDDDASADDRDIDLETEPAVGDDFHSDDGSHEGAVEVPVEKAAAIPKIPALKVDETCNVSAAETGATIVSGKSSASVPSSPNSCARTSFVEQDAGSVENFLGETLDRVADAIDSLMIVDGDDDNNEEIESQGSWSVVQDDENLARAAEMIGSALFNSDNNVGSQVSSVSSVPTTIRSIVNPAQQARWANHLEGLHELGFYDDEKSISIMEMLMAANIGVESDDDVTLEQVVNALMSKN